MGAQSRSTNAAAASAEISLPTTRSSIQRVSGGHEAQERQMCLSPPAAFRSTLHDELSGHQHRRQSGISSSTTLRRGLPSFMAL